MKESQKEKAKKAMAESRKRIAQGLKDVKHTIAVISGKGGVGKSTVAANLATALSMRDCRVGLMDCDMHGPSIPKIVGVEYDERPTGTESSVNPITTRFGLKVMSLGSLLPNRDSAVIWRGPLKTKVIQQFLGQVNWGKLDYLTFDLPPGTGDEPLSIAQFIPDPDGAVIVTTPQKVALQTIRRTVNFTDEVGLPVIGLVENMSGFTCPNCGSKINIFSSGGGEKLAEEFGIPFLGKIPIESKIVESGEKGEPFVLNEGSKAAEAFNIIVNRIKDTIQENSKDKSK